MSWPLFFQILILLIVVVLLVSFCLDMFLDKKKEIIDAETKLYTARWDYHEAEFALLKARNPGVEYVSFPARRL